MRALLFKASCNQVNNSVGIPVKVNIDSGGKPNDVPERR
jgi:hypothetical protein